MKSKAHSHDVCPPAPQLNDPQSSSVTVCIYSLLSPIKKKLCTIWNVYIKQALQNSRIPGWYPPWKLNMNDIWNMEKSPFFIRKKLTWHLEKSPFFYRRSIHIFNKWVGFLTLYIQPTVRRCAAYGRSPAPKDGKRPGQSLNMANTYGIFEIFCWG